MGNPHGLPFTERTKEMDDLKLKVYDDEGNVAKEIAIVPVDLMFGTIRNLMKLLKVDELKDTVELLKTVNSAWDDLTKILSKCLPELKEEDWDYVKVKELLPILIVILKESFSEIMTIPKDEKN